MFDSYCGVRHGRTGAGDGPAAAALTKAPANRDTAQIGSMRSPTT